MAQHKLPFLANIFIGRNFCDVRDSQRRNKIILHFYGDTNEIQWAGEEPFPVDDRKISVEEFAASVGNLVERDGGFVATFPVIDADGDYDPDAVMAVASI